MLLGIALPLNALRATDPGEKDTDEFLDYVMSELRPAVLTTEGDVSVGTDIKPLVRVSNRVHHEGNNLQREAKQSRENNP